MEMSEDKKEKAVNDCIFCKIVKGDIDTEIIQESDNFIAFLDANPKTKGHTLIVPKKHYENILDIPSSLASEMMDNIKDLARERLDEGSEGFNLAMNNFEVAGQVVKHAHTHLIPRRKDDGFSLAV